MAYLNSAEVEARVTIVDNDSTPEQRLLLEQRLPAEVELELVETNLGYGAAANRVLRRGSAELICVSNADARPQPAALAALSAAAAEPRAGMVGPAFDAPTAHYHAPLPGTATMLGRIVVGSFNSRPAPRPATGEVARVGQPSGACFVVQRKVWEQIGGFDEGFFLWYEDVDLARRLDDAGYRNLVVGAATVEHVGGDSFAQVDRRRQQAIRLDSVERYIGKHHRGALPLALALLAVTRRVRAGGG